MPRCSMSGGHGSAGEGTCGLGENRAVNTASLLSLGTDRIFRGAADADYLPGKPLRDVPARSRRVRTRRAHGGSGRGAGRGALLRPWSAPPGEGRAGVERGVAELTRPRQIVPLSPRTTCRF